MKPTVTLIGQDGNVFNVIGRCKIAAKKIGWSKTAIDALVEDLLNAGDYDDVLRMVIDRFDVR